MARHTHICPICEDTRSCGTHHHCVLPEVFVCFDCGPIASEREERGECISGGSDCAVCEWCGGHVSPMGTFCEGTSCDCDERAEMLYHLHGGL